MPLSTKVMMGGRHEPLIPFCTTETESSLFSIGSYETLWRLSQAMGCDDKELFEGGRTIIDHVLKNSDVDIGFDALKEVGTERVYNAPRIQFESFNFPTASGKIEITSDSAEQDGCWRVPRAAVDEWTASGKFRMLLPASNWTLNTSYGNDEKIRQRMGRQSDHLHAKDAEKLNIIDIRIHLTQGALE